MLNLKPGSATQGRYEVFMQRKHSLLDVMAWSHRAKRAGRISEAECAETNALANRLAYADDHQQPAFVTGEERARFALLARRVVPGELALVDATRCLMRFEEAGALGDECAAACGVG